VEEEEESEEEMEMPAARLSNHTSSDIETSFRRRSSNVVTRMTMLFSAAGP
jgi:hypothetical protein